MIAELEARDRVAHGVSRETVSKLDTYANALFRWSQSINLVSANTIKAMWSRHILDSAQLLEEPLLEGDWADLGSGAGVPGMVLAIILAELSPSSTVTLIESDARKCAFLSEAARRTGVSVAIESRRVETILASPATRRFDVVTARALAPLSRLLSYSAPLLAADGVCIFPKGARAEAEIADAARDWRLQIERRPSQTDPRATILLIREAKLVARA